MNLKHDWPLVLIALLGLVMSFNIEAVSNVLPMSIQHYAVLGLAVYRLIKNNK